MKYKETCFSPQNVPGDINNSFRRFGCFGPVYQVMGFSDKTEKGDLMVKIHVFETNEYLDYPFSSVLQDPEENN
jgi:hypothetical protein